ncbi:hypothetical protein DRQ50_04260, partial [bacterium]
MLLLALGVTLVAGAVHADEELDFGLEAQRLHKVQLTGNDHFSDEELKSLLNLEEPSWRNFLN